MRTYDLIIIGSGPGGYIAALYASRFKMRVCVIEKSDLGGTCLNRGCIPTKAMLHCASILSKVKESKEYGIEVSDVRVNFSTIIGRKNAVVLRLKNGIETLFKANKIDVIHGSAKVVEPDTVIVNGEKCKAGNIIIATGSRPMPLPGMPFDEDNVLSSDGILNLKDVPESITIVGGGVIGCEFASLFNSLGTKVTLVEALDRLLPSQSKEVSRKLETLFKKRGITVHTSTKIESVGQSIGSQKKLVCIGRVPNTEGIGLEDLGIDKKDGRILVDDNLRTSVKNIYAIGDCVKGPLLAHKASYDGILACDNIMGGARKADYSNLPNCIWTDPEIASVGLNEEEARSGSADVKVAKFPYLASGKAYIMGRTEGFIKIIGDSQGDILGVEIFGEGSCDLIGEAVIARRMGLKIKDWSHVVHGHPTLSEIFQEASHIFVGTAIHSL